MSLWEKRGQTRDSQPEKKALVLVICYVNNIAQYSFLTGLSASILMPSVLHSERRLSVPRNKLERSEVPHHAKIKTKSIDKGQNIRCSFPTLRVILQREIRDP